MTKRWATWLAIGLCTLAALSYGLGAVLLLLTDPSISRGPTFLPEAMFSSSLLLSVAIGAFVVARRPNPIGWMFCAIGLAWQLRELAMGVSAFTAHTAPDIFHVLLPITSLSLNLWNVSFGLVPLLFILFPDGEVCALGEKLAVWLTVLAILAGLSASDPSFGTIVLPAPATLVGSAIGPHLQDALQEFSGMVDLGLYASAAVLLAVRLRRWRGVKRQQLKWLAYASSLSALLMTLILIPVLVPPLGWLDQNLPYPALIFGGIPFAVALLAVPSAAGIAIFKYHLYDIDLLIRRTLVYAALTVLLALVYLSSVVVLQEVLRTLTAEVSDLAIIVSTLAIAALFAPLRRRIQEIIDRRFYHSKYDMQQVLTAFAARARDEVDLDRLSEELVQVVERTMHPESLSLWLASAKTQRTANERAGREIELGR